MIGGDSLSIRKVMEVAVSGACWGWDIILYSPVENCYSSSRRVLDGEQRMAQDMEKTIHSCVRAGSLLSLAE